ncbi:prefoldin subunit 5-like [Ylistrum balloti]|uniref:prefoldin subunit 5-like n=1 Tax=Ylistrum balloti TaxID=509963 RepID=UPI002905CAF2|nr:prefoldin subunit 5-like [Ylistrum balloti]
MAGKQQQIDVSQLPAPQLNQLTQQLDQEIEFFSNSLNQLKLAQGKFVESQECLNKVSPDNLSKDILVPLTSSMYVPGQLSDVQNVLVDIGTGYYVEMEVNKGKEYFKRKVEYISKQIEKIQPVLQEKYRMKQATMEILQSKIQAMSLQQQGSAPKA